MKKTQKQLPLNWEAKPAVPLTKDPAPSGDPMIDTVNELFAIHELLDGDDFAQERILEQLQEMEASWYKYLQHRAREMLESR